MAGMRKSTQFLTGVLATIGGFVLGNIIAWSSPAESKVGAEANITKDQFKWVASIMTVGAALSQIITAVLMDLLGRKWCIIILSFSIILGWLTLIFWKNFIGYLIARIVLGFFAGGTCVVCPTLVGEIAHKSIRGLLGTFFQLLIVLGILFTYCFTYVNKLLYLNIVSTVFPALLGIGMIFIPESPVYLLKHKKDEKAKKVMVYYRGKDYDVEPEMAEMRQLVERDDTSTWKYFKRKESLRAFFMLLGLQIIQQLCGINAIMFYAEKIFQISHTKVDSKLSGILLGVVQVLATAVSAVTVDRIGRKILWYISLSIMALCEIFLGFYFSLYKSDKNLAEKLGSVPTIAVCLYITGFSLGTGPLPWLMIGEILPTRLKAFVGPFCAFVNWILAFSITISFPILVDKIGIDYIFYSYAVICILGIVFVLFFVIETKNKSLEEIQAMLKVPPKPEAT